MGDVETGVLRNLCETGGGKLRDSIAAVESTVRIQNPVVCSLVGKGSVSKGTYDTYRIIFIDTKLPVSKSLIIQQPICTQVIYSLDQNR